MRLSCVFRLFLQFGGIFSSEDGSDGHEGRQDPASSKSVALGCAARGRRGHGRGDGGGGSGDGGDARI